MQRFLTHSCFHTFNKKKYTVWMSTMYSDLNRYAFIASSLSPWILRSLSTFGFQTINLSLELFYVFIIWWIRRDKATRAPFLRSACSCSALRMVLMPPNLSFIRLLPNPYTAQYQWYMLLQYLSIIKWVTTTRIFPAPLVLPVQGYPRCNIYFLLKSIFASDI